MISCTFSIETRKSNKTGNLYTALWCDLGYSKKLVSVDRNLIIEILNVTPFELANRNEGEVTYIISNERS